MMAEHKNYLLQFSEIRNSDVASVGGKNASLGEMISQLSKTGIRVPGGFAITAAAYRDFLEYNRITARIASRLARLKPDHSNLANTGKAVRKLFAKTSFPPQLEQEISNAYSKLSANTAPASVAVRSSATAEDLPDASFAGQQESFLNIRGRQALLDACRRCYASLFTDRAIAYREHNGFDHMDVALSVGVQVMVRSDKAGAGVMFSIDTETGFPDAVLISAAWGLGEAVVQGAVDPDEYMVFKPLLKQQRLAPIIEKNCGAKASKIVYASGKAAPTAQRETSKKEQNSFVLDDSEILQLARWACALEQHYGFPMDMEWAKDGVSGELFIVQARPETVQAKKAGSGLKRYRLHGKGALLTSGYSVGDAIATGKVCRLDSPRDIDKFPAGGILVTGNTDPDWVPLMKRAAAIITDHGGRTSHAAIVSRELGLPAIIGCGDATAVLKSGQEVTASCAEGEDGFVYAGLADFSVELVDLQKIPETATSVMLNLANPSAALKWWQLPADGVGLARMEFIVNNHIKIHPLAVLQDEREQGPELRRRIKAITRAYSNPQQFFVDTLARGIAKIAAVAYPHPVIVRMSDFKTNEYSKLLGGDAFEPQEANPMIGWRGSSRYYSEGYRAGFALECQAIRKAREEIGFDNIIIMIPFCRTLKEADKVIRELARNKLKRGKNGLQVYVMCELPSNVILAREFAAYFDGFSIGSNDLTQLTLGIDRDSELLSELFSEEDPAVLASIEQVIKQAHRADRKIGLCGQAPSDRPGFARLLVRAGIDSISVSPDSFLNVKQTVAKEES
jgi:pyruvate,water dikinase